MINYVVGLLLLNNKVEKYTVISMPEGKRMVITEEELIETIKMGCRYANIRLNNNNKVEFTIGKYEDYPKIEASTWDTFNTYNMTVLGCYEQDGEEVYLMSNHQGTLKLVNENEIYQFKYKYRAIGCKVVTIGGKNVIKLVKGKLQKIVDNTIFRYDETNRLLSVYCIKTPSKLVIPNKVDNCTMDRINWIRTIPDNEIKNIKSIVFPEVTIEIRSSAFNSMGTLEEITVLGELYSVKQDVFSNMKGLKKVRFNKVFRTKDIVSYSPEVREVSFKEQPLEYENSAFFGCKKLIVNDMFNEGLVRIGEYAFGHCSEITTISFPRTLKIIDSSAFRDCKNLRTISIKSNVLINDTITYERFLEGCKDTTIYCPYDYPIKHLERVTAEGVKVVRGNQEKCDKDTDNRILKAVMLGVDLNLYDLAKGREQIINTLKFMNKVEFKKQLTEFLNVVTRINTHDIPIMIGKQGLFIRVWVNFVEYRGTLEKALLGKKYAVMIFTELTYIIPIDKDIIIEWLLSERGLKYQQDDKTLLIPRAVLAALDDTVLEMYEQGNELVVKTITQENRFGIKDMKP